MITMPRKQGNTVNLDQRRTLANRSLLEPLFASHGIALRAFLRGVMNSGQDVEDVLHEMYLKLVNMSDLRNKIPSEAGRQKSYLFAIANNMAVDLERKRQVQQRFRERELSERMVDSIQAIDSPEQTAMVIEELQAVKAAILKLKPRWRQAFVCSRFKHMTYRQISEEMGVSIKQVEQYMKEALMRVRDAAFEDRRQK